MKRVEANDYTAQRPTGPRTAEGKARSSKNALRHGLRSPAPVLSGESAQEWERHRVGVVGSLAPAAGLEAELADRVALSLWRLRRAVAYETAVTAVGLEEAAQEVRRVAEEPILMPGESEPDVLRLHRTQEELKEKSETLRGGEGALELLRRLPDLPDGAPLDAQDVYGALLDVGGELLNATEEYFDLEDPDFLAGLGVPPRYRDDPWAWDGWTAGAVRRAVAEMARDFDAGAADLLAAALRERQKSQAEDRAECERLRREAARVERRLRAEEDRLRRKRMLPDGPTLDKLMRYEAHLGRQMLQALHTLERLQAARAGERVPPPAALDVTVSGPALPAPVGNPPDG
jgi:hypothetical protein